MNISASDVERMVREALAAMMQAPSGEATRLLSASTTRSEGPRPSDASDWICSDAVIGLESLRAVPKNTTSIRIRKDAVVTPAAKDWMRERRVLFVRNGELPRQSPSTIQGSPSDIQATQKLSESVPTPQRLLIAGVADWLPGLAKQLCTRQTKVESRQADDTSSIRAIASALRAGHRSAMAIVESPHAALWQMARDDAMRPAVVSHWMDLNDVLREVPANVLILSVRRWNVAGAANVARRFLEHQRSQS